MPIGNLSRPTQGPGVRAERLPFDKNTPVTLTCICGMGFAIRSLATEDPIGDKNADT